MTSRRTMQRTYAFDCDECGHSLDTERFSFGEALETMKAQGWKAVHDGDGWKHQCEDCA